MNNFINTINKQTKDKTPVWFMRQAGRYLPEYRELRAKNDFVTMCKTPELASEVTLQPMRRFEYDAAIIFSDILIVPEAMGMNFTIGEGEGPILSPPVRTEHDVDSLSSFDPHKKTDFLSEAIKLTVKQLPDDIPLIGFAGAPFTVASYMVDGRGTKNHLETKKMMCSKTDIFLKLLDKISDSTIEYLKMQVDSGCTVLQLFDSWAGEVPEELLGKFVLPQAKRIISEVKKHKDIPIIYFPRNCGSSIEDIKQVNADCYSIDWKTDLSRARRQYGADTVLQGNLDPTVLFSSEENIKNSVAKILDDAGPNHIFNLGHGILPETPLSSVKVVLDAVKNHCFDH